MAKHSGFCDPRKLIHEAVSALARLDADRLEEMALSSEALVRGHLPALSLGSKADALASFDLRRELAVFARVLNVTQANMNVLRRLSELRSTSIEYGCRPGRNWTVTEILNGHN